MSIGDKFSKWEIISTDLHRNNNGQIFVLCRCECGKEKLVQRSRLFKGLSLMCKSCAPKFYRQGLGKGKHKGVGLIPRTFYDKIKRNSIMGTRASRQMDFDVTIEQLWELYQRQDGKCALSGIQLKLNEEKVPVRNKSYSTYVTASVDRINSNDGYTINNIQWVHKRVNLMKNAMTDEQFIYLCNLVANHNHGNFEPSRVNTDFLAKVSRKVQRLTDEDSVSNNSDTSVQHPSVILDEDIV